MKKLILLLLLASPLFAQRPIGTVISGSTSAGVPATIRTSAAGEVYITTAAGILAQRPTGTVVSGATSAGIPQTFLTETDGTLHVTCTGCGSGDLAGSLTATRVPFASGVSTLVDDADLTFTGGNTLHATNLVVSGTCAGCGGAGTIAGTISANQIAFGAGVDEIGGDAGFTFDPTSTIALSLSLYRPLTDAYPGAFYINVDPSSVESVNSGGIGLDLKVKAPLDTTINSLYGASIQVQPRSNSVITGEILALNLNAGVFSGTVATSTALRIEDVTGATNNYAIKTGLGKVDFASGGFVFDPTLAVDDAGVSSLALARAYTAVAMEDFPYAYGSHFVLTGDTGVATVIGNFVEVTTNYIQNAAFSSGSSVAVQGQITFAGDDDSAAAYGGQFNATKTGAGDLSSLIGLFIQSIPDANTANAYGLLVSDVSGAGTLNRSILTGTGIAQFGDDVYALNGATWKDVHAANFVLESSSVNAGTTDAHSGSLSVYDVNGTAFRDFLTWTNGNAPSVVIGIPTTGTLAIDATTYKVGGVTPLTVCTAGVIKVTSGIVLDFGALVTC